MKTKMILGSESDIDKVISGIEKKVNEAEKLEIEIHCASAHRVPEKVEDILKYYQRVLLTRPKLVQQTAII